MSKTTLETDDRLFVWDALAMDVYKRVAVAGESVQYHLIGTIGWRHIHADEIKECIRPSTRRALELWCDFCRQEDEAE